MPYNLQNKIDAYNRKTTERGHAYHSDAAINLYKEEHAGCEKDRSVVRANADKAADSFLNEARDPKLPGHAASRSRYLNEFDGNEDAVRKHYRDMHEDAHGLNNPHFRNSAYENGVLNSMKPAKTSSLDDAANYKAFCSLMKAKWDAEGYDGDEAVISDFTRNYLSASQRDALVNKVPDSGISNKASSVMGKKMADKSNKLDAEQALADNAAKEEDDRRQAARNRTLPDWKK